MSGDKDFGELLEPTNKWTLNNLANQFLWDCGVDDEDFDYAKNELAQLIRIARENPDEELTLFEEEEE